MSTLSQNAIYFNPDKLFAETAARPDAPGMADETWSERLKARARELGMTDVAVARRAGLSQSRYASYVTGAREPDFATLGRVCSVLGTTPDVVLGFRRVPAKPSRSAVEVRALSALAALDASTQRLALAALEGIADAALPEGRARPQTPKTKRTRAEEPPKPSRRRTG